MAYRELRRELRLQEARDWLVIWPVFAASKSVAAEPRARRTSE
jgi:hypothetical protein